MGVLIWNVITMFKEWNFSGEINSVYLNLWASFIKRCKLIVTVQAWDPFISGKIDLIRLSKIDITLVIPNAFGPMMDRSDGVAPE